MGWLSRSRLGAQAVVATYIAVMAKKYGVTIVTARHEIFTKIEMELWRTHIDGECMTCGGPAALGLATFLMLKASCRVVHNE